MNDFCKCTDFVKGGQLICMKCGKDKEFCERWSPKRGKCGKRIGECGCFAKV